MPVVDLYTPRIETREKAREFNVAQAQKGFQDASTTLMDWAKNKSLIDKAFMESAMKAENQKNQNVYEEKLRQNELLNRRINAATYMLSNFPDSDTDGSVKEGLETDIATVTGSIEGRKAFIEATKPGSTIGNLVRDYQAYLVQGGKPDDEISSGYMKQILDSKDLPDPERVIINDTIKTQGMEAGWKKLLELKAAGRPGGTDVKVTIPSAEEQEKLHVAQIANGQLADIEKTWAAVQQRAKERGWFNRPSVGKGAETINNMLAYVGMDDPLVTSLQKQVNEYNQTQIRLTAGLNQTEMESLRAQGYLLNNGLPPSQFETTLQLNKRWAAQDYDLRWMQEAIRSGAIGGGVSGGKPKGGIMPPKADVDTPPVPGVPQPGTGKSGAATENKTGGGSGSTSNLKKNADAVQRRIDELNKKARQGKKPPAQQPPAQSPQSMLFQRSLEYPNAYA